MSFSHPKYNENELNLSFPNFNIIDTMDKSGIIYKTSKYLKIL